MTATQKTTKSSSLPKILCTALLFTAFLCFFSARWFVSVYGRLGFDCILFTLSASLGGVQSGLIIRYFLTAIVPCLLCTAAVTLFLIVQPWRRESRYQTHPRRRLPLILPVMLSVGLLIFAAFDVQLVDYLINRESDSELYEIYYADPEETEITFPEEKQNLVYIMLESMETSYLAEEQGGAMEENLIPELYELAADNTCFSDSEEEVGGFYCTAGATWTIGSMVAQTAGIPLKTPTEDVNQYGKNGEEFLPGVTSLTDILDEAGYNQALMVGSDVRFGGREAYYSQHGVDEIYDIYTARTDDIIPDDYFVWWGMEDMHLFEYAKQELTELAAEDEPFAFTMLTVDTHHVGGYQCAECEASASGEVYDQSISCSSEQVAEFVGWIDDQPFAEDTTIIIVGDHESMDNGYFERNVDDDYQRHVYNCFINPETEAENTTNRQYAAVDLFPTTLAAIGCEIEGDRLGLGTNLFSDTPTLAETMGIYGFNAELAKSSEYYEEYFYEE